MYISPTLLKKLLAPIKNIGDIDKVYVIEVPNMLWYKVKEHIFESSKPDLLDNFFMNYEMMPDFGLRFEGECAKLISMYNVKNVPTIHFDEAMGFLEEKMPNLFEPVEDFTVSMERLDEYSINENYHIVQMDEYGQIRLDITKYGMGQILNKKRNDLVYKYNSLGRAVSLGAKDPNKIFSEYIRLSYFTSFVMHPTSPTDLEHVCQSNKIIHEKFKQIHNGIKVETHRLCYDIMRTDVLNLFNDTLEKLNVTARKLDDPGTKQPEKSNNINDTLFKIFIGPDYRVHQAKLLEFRAKNNLALNGRNTALQNFIRPIYLVYMIKYMKIALDIFEVASRNQTINIKEEKRENARSGRKSATFEKTVQKRKKTADSKSKFGDFNALEYDFENSDRQKHVVSAEPLPQERARLDFGHYTEFLREVFEFGQWDLGMKFKKKYDMYINNLDHMDYDVNFDSPFTTYAAFESTDNITKNYSAVKTMYEKKVILRPEPEKKPEEIYANVRNKVTRLISERRKTKTAL